MHKLSKALTFMGALLALALVSCGSDSDDGSEAVTPQSGIYTESGAYYINVDSQSAPSDGNGAW